MNKFIRTAPKLTELVDQLFTRLKSLLRMHSTPEAAPDPVRTTLRAPRHRGDPRCSAM